MVAWRIHWLNLLGIGQADQRRHVRRATFRRPWKEASHGTFTVDFALGLVVLRNDCRRVVGRLPQQRRSTAQQCPIHRVSGTLSNELNATGLFEVVNVAHNLELAGRASMIAGRYDEQLLADMANVYRADAVIVARVTAYHPYDPQRIALTFHLIGTFDANVLAAVNGVWDINQPAVASRAEQLSHRIQATTPHAHDISLQSPRYFAAFVAHEIAAKLAARPHVAATPNERSHLCRSTSTL